MPMLQEQIEVQLKTMRIGAFPGGMNTSVPANEIDDGQAVRIRNMEYDDSDNLVARNGVIGAGGIVGVWDTTLWDASLWDFLGTTYPSRITSILDFEGASAFVGILYTTGTKLLSRTLSGAITDLTGSLVLPDGVRWYWKIFNGVAIGVNGLTSGDNPIQVVSPSPGTASKLTTAPVAKFIEVFKNRLWIVRADKPNQLQASDIGSHTSWNTDAGANPAHGALWDVDKDDGDFITAIFATKERLFIWKRNSIHVMDENPEHPNDLRYYRLTRYSSSDSKIGCLAASTIQTVFDDVLFLSRGGIASLSAAQIVADFESAVISHNIADIQDIFQDLNDEDICSGVISDRSQYWLCVASNVSASAENITYVFDYRGLKRNLPRWLEFDGLAFGTSFEVLDHDNDKLVYLLGCHDIKNNNFFIGQYIPKARNKTFIDSSLAIRYEILTKAYDFNLPDLRKYLSKWFARIISLTQNVGLSVSYYLDEQSNAVHTYTFNLGVVAGGALFDDPLTLFDTNAEFDSGVEFKIDRIWRSFIFDKLRKANVVQFRFLNAQENQGFGILTFAIKYEELSEYQSQTV